MSLLRRESRSWASEPIVSPFPGVGLGGFGASNADAALRVSAVWACVRLLADSVSMMPLSAYTLRGDIRQPIPTPPLLARPSADATMNDWLYMLMVSALLRGNAYGHVMNRDGLGYPTQIELVNPDAASCRVDRTTGQVAYRINGHEVPKADVFHFRAYRFPGQPQGLSPIQYAAQAIQTDQAVSNFALGYFVDGVHPTSVYESDQTITQDQAKTIKERIMASVRGREPLVLGAGLKRVPIAVSPEESQFLSTQKYGVAEISRIFGVPPEMIAAEAGNSLTYANVEQRGMDFLTYSVQPWLSRIETAFAQLLPGQKHVRFDTSVLVRTDFETTIKTHAIAIASKQETVDEARAAVDKAPLTAAQKADLELVPLTVTPSGLPRDLPAAPADPGPVADLTAPAARSAAAPQEIHVHNHPAGTVVRAMMPEGPTPVVNVTVEEREQPAPVIHVEQRDMPAPVVNVTVDPTPVSITNEVNVEPAPVAVDVRPAVVVESPQRNTVTEVERDSRGLIVKTTTKETDA